MLCVRFAPSTLNSPCLVVSGPKALYEARQRDRLCSCARNKKADKSSVGKQDELVAPGDLTTLVTNGGAL